MAQTTISTNNFNKPAPKWYRHLRIIVYSLFVTALFSETLQRFGLSDGDVNYITGWLIAIIETIGKLLANGEVYALSNDQKIIIIEVDALPSTGITGVWYYYNNNYWYWNGTNWVALYEPLGPGGGTNPPPTGLPPIN